MVIESNASYHNEVSKRLRESLGKESVVYLGDVGLRYYNNDYWWIPDGSEIPRLLGCERGHAHLDDGSVWECVPRGTPKELWVLLEEKHHKKLRQVLLERLAKFMTVIVRDSYFLAKYGSCIPDVVRCLPE